MRKGESSKATMASAAKEDVDAEYCAAVQAETSIRPCMPHLTYPALELDVRYPPLVAPPDEGLVDLSDDERDAVYQHGLGIAEGIRAEVEAQGRRRRPEQQAAAFGPTNDAINSVTLCPTDQDYNARKADRTA